MTEQKALFLELSLDSCISPHVQNCKKQNFEICLMKTLRPPCLFSLPLTLALAAGLAVSAVNSRAQADASAQITYQAVAGGYDYTLTLNNTGSSALQTFWFSWEPTYNYDFMSAVPTSIVSPSGWSGNISSYYNYYYGYNYGIEFSSSTSPLAANGTLNFSFDSTMTPTQMGGNDPTYGYPVGTFYVSTGAGWSGTESGQLVATVVVPEPSSLALLAVGSFGLWLVRARQRHRSALAENRAQ